MYNVEKSVLFFTQIGARRMQNGEKNFRKSFLSTKCSKNCFENFYLCVDWLRDTHLQPKLTIPDEQRTSNLHTDAQELYLCTVMLGNKDKRTNKKRNFILRQKYIDAVANIQGDNGPNLMEQNLQITKTRQPISNVKWSKERYFQNR